jgi:hypothetical protein
MLLLFSNAILSIINAVILTFPPLELLNKSSTAIKRPLARMLLFKEANMFSIVPYLTT